MNYNVDIEEMQNKLNNLGEVVRDIVKRLEILEKQPNKLNINIDELETVKTEYTYGENEHQPRIFHNDNVLHQSVTSTKNLALEIAEKMVKSELSKFLE